MHINKYYKILAVIYMLAPLLRRRACENVLHICCYISICYNRGGGRDSRRVASHACYGISTCYDRGSFNNFKSNEGAGTHDVSPVTHVLAYNQACEVVARGRVGAAVEMRRARSGSRASVVRLHLKSRDAGHQRSK